MMNDIRPMWVMLFLLCFLPPVQAAETSLPTPLELRYRLHYGVMTVGQVTKTLTQDSNGIYHQRTRSKPEGMARLFTEVEWMEEGEFEIRQGQIRPLRFLEYRVGADKPHRHEAFFDWANRKVRYYNNRVVEDLPEGTQDQGSLIYSFMLQPPAPGVTRDLHVSSGKKLRDYRYAESGRETITTALGRFATRIIERTNHLQTEEGLKVWLAVEHRNLPVRIATIKRGETTFLELEGVSGAMTLPVRKQ